MPQSFTIPDELPDLNSYIRAERGNRYAAAKLKAEWTEVCMWAAMRVGLERVARPVYVLCTWFTKDSRKDPDNVAFARKFLMDGLVDAGVLPSDGRRWVRGFRDEFRVDAANPRVEVVLREAEE